MSNSKQKIKFTLWLSGIILFGATLYVSGFALAKPAQAGFLDDWLCQLFGECEGGQQVPQPGPAPVQPQPQPEPTPVPSEPQSEASGEDENSGCVSQSYCQSSGGRVAEFCRSGDVQCVFPRPAGECNYNGVKDPGETSESCPDVPGKANPSATQLLYDDCGCYPDGYKKECATPVNQLSCTGNCYPLRDRCGGGDIPFAPGVDGSGGQGGQGGTGGQGSGDGSGIFGPGGLFGPGGSFGGGGDGAGAGSTQCSDGQDNDNDGKIDREDPGCNGPLYNPADNSEFNYKIREVIPDFFNLNWFKFNFVNFSNTRPFA